MTSGIVGVYDNVTGDLTFTLDDNGMNAAVKGLVNISGDVTTTLGNSGPAMDSLRVFALDVEPVPANTLRGLMLMTLLLVLLAVWKLPRGMSVGRR